MKRTAVIALLAVLPLVLSPSGTASSQEDEPLAGRIIALDAGHGGESDLGAQYPADEGTAAEFYEKDVNLAVVYGLKDRLEEAGAHVVLTREADETIISRRERVDIAIEKCMLESERKCDALVSVHHNGSNDSSYDGLLVIYNERQDLPLAIDVHDALQSGLYYPTNSDTYQFKDEGLRHGGYGITVYDHLVSVLSEAYYITNDWEAAQYRAGTRTCFPDGKPDDCRWVLVGARTNEEATALYEGVLAYFMDGGGEKCPPGKQEQGKC